MLASLCNKYKISLSFWACVEHKWRPFIRDAHWRSWGPQPQQNRRKGDSGESCISKIHCRCRIPLTVLSKLRAGGLPLSPGHCGVGSEDRDEVWSKAAGPSVPASLPLTTYQHMALCLAGPAPIAITHVFKNTSSSKTYTSPLFPAYLLALGFSR